MEDDYKIYDECVAELSKDARTELDAMVEDIQNNLRARRRNLRPTGLGEKGAKEVIVCLIQAGFLPVPKTDEDREVQRRMSQWGIP